MCVCAAVVGEMSWRGSSDGSHGVFVRLLHSDGDLVAPSSDSRASSSPLVIDTLSDEIPLWDPFDFSSLAQTQLLLRLLDRSKALLVVDLGYSTPNEGSTLARRRQVEGDDSLGWYLFGSGHGSSFMTHMVDRSCANGGTCWMSMFAIGRGDIAVDLFAPFLPASKGANAAPSKLRQQRHDDWTQTMMFTSSKQALTFFTDHVLASVSFQSRRSTLTYVLSFSNDYLNESVTIVIANQMHYHMVADGFFPRLNMARAADPPSGGDLPRSAVRGQAALQQVALRYERLAQARPASALPPILITRIDRLQRQDPLACKDLLEMVVQQRRTPQLHKHFEVEPARQVAPPDPLVAVSEASFAGEDAAELELIRRQQQQQQKQEQETAATLAHLSTMQQLRQQVDASQLALRELENDLRQVLQATEELIVEHRSTRESTQLCRLEADSAYEALMALRDHNRELEHSVSQQRVSVEVLKERALGSRESVDSMLFKLAEADRRELKELVNRFVKEREELRCAHQTSMTAIRNEFDVRQSDAAQLHQKQVDDLQGNIKHIEENIQLSIQNFKTVEADCGSLSQQLTQLRQQEASLDASIKRAENALSRLHVCEKTEKQQLEELDALRDKSHSVDIQMSGLAKEIQRIDERSAVVRQQLRKLKDARQLEVAAASKVVNRYWSISKSAFFAQESASRSDTVAEAQQQFSHLAQLQHRAFRAFVDRAQMVTAEAATNEMIADINAAQKREYEINNQIQQIDAATRESHIELEQLLVNQEKALAGASEECNQALLHIDALRKLQKEKFAARDADLRTTKMAYRHLVQEFLVQVHSEVTIASKRLKASRPAATSSTNENSSVGKLKLKQATSASSSRSVSPAPSAPKQGPELLQEFRLTAAPPLRSRDLTTHNRLQQLNDESHWNSCVQLYLQWVQELSVKRDTETELAQARIKTSRIESACLSVAESLGLERKRLAAVEADLKKAAAANADAREALKEFVAAASTQRAQMEASIATQFSENQAAFKELVAAVSVVEDHIKSLDVAMEATQQESSAVAFQLEAMKDVELENLQKKFQEKKDEASTWEKRLRLQRQHQRDKFGISAVSGFQSLDAESALRAMGVASSRDYDLFTTSGRVGDDSLSSDDHNLSNVLHDDAMSVASRGTSPSLAPSVRAPESVASRAATFGNNNASRPLTPLESVFYFPTTTDTESRT